MQNMNKLILLLIITAASSCGGSSKKDKEGSLTDKKIQLGKLKTDRTKTDDKIRTLEAEVAKMDTGSGKSVQAKLVSIDTVKKQNFSHYIDLQAKIDAENISYISPRGMGGQVREIHVKKGDMVHKGQLLLRLDNAIQKQNAVAIKQGMASVRTQLDLARSVYARQQNLWNQNIGTEVQLLQAKSNRDVLENQLKTMNENVRLAQEQVNLSNVYSDVSGVADAVDIHVGETFTGSSTNGIKIINTSSLKVITDIPENYLGRIKKGTKVQVVVPDVSKTFSSTVSLLSQSINANSRGVSAEARIPYDPLLKPGQTAVMKFLDYASDNVVVIPINLVQTDETGKYIYVMEKLADGRMVARKKVVLIGEVYGTNVEIKSGLLPGDHLITGGFQSLYEGQVITSDIK